MTHLNGFIQNLYNLFSGFKNGGGERARTVDPLRARQVLSQLSYTPMKTLSVPAIFCDQLCGIYLVGLDRFELSTSRLSGVRSNQLSYRPISKGLQRTPILKCPIFYRIGVKDIAGIDLDSSVSLKVISAP